MSNIEWEDGAVCYVNGKQWFHSSYYMLTDGDGNFLVLSGGVGACGLQLNNLKFGDCISKSELDTEDKYNKAVEVFKLFGYQEEVNYELMLEYGGIAVDVDGIFIAVSSDNREVKRRFAFNQLMAIGELKRLMNERESDIKSKVNTSSGAIDKVKSPSHYQLIDGVESIEIIARSLTQEQWKGFCLGNMLKYRIRAGKKDDLQQDIDKAKFYGELYEMHKGKCYE